MKWLKGHPSQPAVPDRTAEVIRVQVEINLLTAAIRKELGALIEDQAPGGHQKQKVGRHVSD